MQELLPSGLYDQQMTLAQALKIIHRPSADIDLRLFEQGRHPAQVRLIMEELLAQNLSMLAIRSQGQQDVDWPLAPSTNSNKNSWHNCPFTE